MHPKNIIISPYQNYFLIINFQEIILIFQEKNSDIHARKNSDMSWTGWGLIGLGKAWLDAGW